jgi:hypothetical protein
MDGVHVSFVHQESRFGQALSCTVPSLDFNLDRAGIQKLIEMESEQSESLKITDADSIIDAKLLAEARQGN